MASFKTGIRSPVLVGQIVAPRLVQEKSLATSVTDLIHDVMPQSSSSIQKPYDAETVEWVMFETADLDDVSCRDALYCLNGKEPPLLIVCGFSRGYQLWAATANGECQELLSVRECSVKHVKLLPCPETDSLDLLADRRPLLALCDSSSAGAPFCAVSVLSLRNGDQVQILKFAEPVCAIGANRRVVVVSLTSQIVVFDAATLSEQFIVKECAQLPTGEGGVPFALGDAWLAYSDAKIIQALQSCGGVCSVDSGSYTAAVFNVAKSFGKNLTSLGESVASHLSGKAPAAAEPLKTRSTSGSELTERIVGTVTVINVARYCADSDGGAVVAHFPAHIGEMVTALRWNPTGQLLFTSGQSSNEFHIFHVLPHPICAAMGAVHHLYTLVRGATPARVVDVTFASDSRWLAVTTNHETTHLFPINPYGGLVTIRTHSSPHIVNRMSRFHRSAGLEQLQDPSAGPPSPPKSGPGGHSPRTGSARGSPVTKEIHPSLINGSIVAASVAGNPRLPPYPTPTVVYAFAKLRQKLMSIPGLSVGAQPAAVNSDRPAKMYSSQIGTQGMQRTLATMFASARGAPSINPSARRDKALGDCLFVMNTHGELIEYDLSVLPATHGSRVDSEGAIELRVTPGAQWALQRTRASAEIKLPLVEDHPLLVADRILSGERQRKRVASRGSLSEADVLFETNCDSDSSSSSTGHRSGKAPASWLSEIEISTYGGPGRRLWMGPQFTFKQYMEPSHSPTLVTIDDTERYMGRSQPVSMPVRPPKHAVPVVIEAGSGSFESSAGMTMEVCGSWSDNDFITADEREGHVRQRIAEAMGDQCSPASFSTGNSRDSSSVNLCMRAEEDDDNGLFMPALDC